MLSWKTQIWEKPRQSTDCKRSLWKEYRDGAQRQRSLALFLRQRAVTMEATTSFSLSHALCTQLGSIHIIQHNSTTQLLNKLALSHIYSHMTFGLFTHIALGALSWTYSPKCSFLPVGEVTTGPSNIRFWSRPIRRDLFPNNNDVDDLIAM